ncbi:MAG: hypothetical protein ABG776_12025, partial [Cyanobacteria bacterium J06555_13]
RDQNPLPYHLATPHRFRLGIVAPAPLFLARADHYFFKWRIMPYRRAIARARQAAHPYLCFSISQRHHSLNTTAPLA